MWGDPERAASLEPSDALYTLLLQVTGPAHIPWNDVRWQEVLHGYNVWAHVESHTIQSACQSMAKHAATSSNLAAFCLHVARMLQDLIKSTCSSESTENEEDDDFTQTIALVGKARATAGALNLLRILIHFVLAHNSKHLEQVFVYRNRDITERHAANRMAGHDLCHASLAFVSSMSRASWQRVPELYDATHQTLQLVLVLCSTQLYQPMISSAQRRQQQQQHLANQSANYFMDYILKQAQKRHAELQHKPIASYESALGEPTPPAVSQNVLLLDSWTPASVLEACLSWQLNRPAAPERSIAHHYAQLATSVVQSKEKQVGPDGMYESHFVVMASRPKPPTKSKSPNSASSSTSTTHLSAYGKPPSQLILDVTRGVLILSSSLILLPFRFLSLALGLWHHHSNRDDVSHDAVRKRHLQSTVKSRGRTNDVLWLSDSPIADLASVLFLLLVHNYRAPPRNGGKQGNHVEFNPFRVELAQLGDERWEAGALDPIPDEGHEDPFASFPVTNGDNSQYASFVNSEESVSLSKPLLRTNGATSTMTRPQHLTTNFESLLESFGDTVHTEVGALMLYTILQSSPTFASFIVVRSDLDTVVMPLLRTLYFSSALKHYSPHGISSSKNNARDNTALQLKSCPFRSPSQLYVILILLLLFSQDASFGPDAFRRIIVPSVPWYKERQLVNINLGSVLLLVLLRSVTFNLNKLQDAFLLSNCCAVLMNLSHNIVELHDYAAMRLVSVAVSTLKRYSLLWSKNGNHASDDHDSITTPVGMYGEVSHTLLRVLRHCIDSQHIERNLHLVYALVYHQSDFNMIASKKPCPFKNVELASIQTVVGTASTLIQESGDARTAPKAMAVLRRNMSQLKEAVSKAEHAGSDDSGDFTFTYEEEADPEIFFIPYVWEVVVCVATASSIEWEKEKIMAFELLQEQEEEDDDDRTTTLASTGSYSQDVSDLV